MGARGAGVTGRKHIEIGGVAFCRDRDPPPGRAGRNPRAAKIFYVPARRKTHFKPGRLLKEALHQTREEVALEVLDQDDETEEGDE